MPYIVFEHNGSAQWGWYLFGANNVLMAWNAGFNSKAGARKAFRRVRSLLGKEVVLEK